MATLQFYPGQLDYLARIGTKDCAYVAADTGCHAPGTLILMSDGSTKPVESVGLGDAVMGWDSSPRRVVQILHGTGPLHRITPTKGEAFVVNSDHLLTLVQTNSHHSRRSHLNNGRILDVTVRDYLGWTAEYRHIHKLFRVPIAAWAEPNAPMVSEIDPWLLGMLIGDGHLGHGQVAISKPDPEVQCAIHEESSIRGWRVREVFRKGCTHFHLSQCPDLRAFQESCGLAGALSGDKFIPVAFLRSDRTTRLQLLAGLLDSDGHLTHDHSSYDWISKSRRLADDMAFLARSLGLAAYIRQCSKFCQTGAGGTFYRVSISGHTEQIPCKIARKQSRPRTQVKDALRTGFSVEPVGTGDYFGFTIEGDGRYVLGDFTVTHNCGKTLMQISMARLKLEKEDGTFAGRALFVVPGSTLRTDDDDDDETGPGESLSQWCQELRRFAPNVPVHTLTCWADYKALLRPDGSAPPGIYISYYEAMFRNGAIQSVPDSWKGSEHARLCEAIGAPVGGYAYSVLARRVGHPNESPIWFEPHHTGFIGCPEPQEGQRFEWNATYYEVLAHNARPVADYASGIGKESKDGRAIRCVARPCLSDEILMWAGAHGHNAWDLAALDEAHICCNLDAQVTRSLIRVPARYRFAFTATPIPNVITNLAPLMGWICVPDWYKGDHRNAAFPYARSEIGKFEATFISLERDHTEESMRSGRSRSRSKVIRTSPVISSPARLLKILKPTLAFISKPMCREEYRPPELIDIRVPMGEEQSRLYAHFMCRSRVPGKHPLAKARRQIAYLRGVCSDPAGFEHGGPKVHSNFNPKTIAALNMIHEILQRGEQVVVISARVGQTDTMAQRLADAGIPYARIDSTIAPDGHSREAARFKSGAVPVMLMGIKCAASHSFSQCPNEIILSLEYSFGSLHQARGRVDRVNSPRPARIYCILHKDSIEEAMFDRVATKEDAARICLHGKRLPRDYKPMDAGEVMAEHFAHWETLASRSRRAFNAMAGTTTKEVEIRTETDCLSDWPVLRDALAKAWSNHPSAPTPPPPPPATVPEPECIPMPRPTPSAEPAHATRRMPAWLARFRAARSPEAVPA